MRTTNFDEHNLAGVNHPARFSALERYWQSEWRLYDELNLACFKQ